MVPSESSGNEPPMYPPPEWLNHRYDPWINKSGIDEMADEQSPNSDSVPEINITAEWLLVRAVEAGYIREDDVELYGEIAVEIIARLCGAILEHGDDPEVVLASWGVIIES